MTEHVDVDRAAKALHELIETADPEQRRAILAELRKVSAATWSFVARLSQHHVPLANALAIERLAAQSRNEK